MQTQNPKKRSKLATMFMGVGAVLVACCGLSMIGTLVSSRGTPAATPVISMQLADGATVMPLATATPVDAILAAAQKECESRFIEVHRDGNTAVVRCRVRKGARAEASVLALGDFRQIARAAMEQTDVAELRMTFIHTVHDAYGNDSDHEAMTMVMPRALAEKLKWDNVYSDDLLSLLATGDSGAKIEVSPTWKQ